MLSIKVGKCISVPSGLLSLLLVAFQALSAIATPVAPSHADRSPSPEAWLKGVGVALQTVVYRGVFIYQQGSQIEAFAVTHTVIDGLAKERILYLDGLPREVVRQGQRLIYATPNHGVTRFQHDRRLPMADPLANIVSNKQYQVAFANKAVDRVAGRETVVLSITPTDHHRYGYQLWLDTQTGLLLKSFMLNSRQQIIERFQFTHIEPNVLLSPSEQAAMDKSNAPADTVVTMAQQTTASQHLWGWEAGWIPAGFTAQSYSQRPSPIGKRQADVVVYSDGLAHFSIFVEPHAATVFNQASSTIGALATVSKVFRKKDDYFHVMVVGEVPLGTAERIAISVRPTQQRPAKSPPIPAA